MTAQINQLDYSRASLLADFDRGIDKYLLSVSRINARYDLSESEALFEIEKFVDLVIKKGVTAFNISEESVSPTVVGKGFKNIYPLSFIFPSYLFYCEKVTVFLYSCWLASKASYPVDKLYMRDDFDTYNFAEYANMVVSLIQMYSAQDWYKRAERDRWYQAKENGKSVSDYVRDILGRYSRTLVVRVDLGYLKEFGKDIRIEDVERDFNNFRYLISYDRRLKHLRGYVWSIEQSEMKGYHMHAAFFFDGSKSRQDISLGIMIGKVWENEITKGRGSFYNCNQHKVKYQDDLGIGMIHRDDSNAFENTIRSINYIPKSGEYQDRREQYLRIKTCPKMRTFGSSIRGV